MITRKHLTHWTHWLAVGLGSGLAPRAPGTFGTLAALPFVIFFHVSLSAIGFLVATLMLTVIAVICADRAQRDWGIHDPGNIVIDEWAGLAVTLLFIPANWQAWCAAFVLFRFFDIVKPWPIRWLDRNVKGGVGNVLDDVVAGGMACTALHLFLIYF